MSETAALDTLTIICIRTCTAYMDGGFSQGHKETLPAKEFGMVSTIYTRVISRHVFGFGLIHTHLLVHDATFGACTVNCSVCLCILVPRSLLPTSFLC